MRALVTGWFSFDAAEVTAGDLLARDTVAQWLRDAEVPMDSAVTANFRRPGELSLDEVDPADYSHLLFVCGPAAGAAVEDLFARFPDSRRIAVNVSVVPGTARLEPVTVVERDGPDTGAPDLSLWAETSRTPVVGVVLAHDQPEYGDRQRHDEVHGAIETMLKGSDVAPVVLDTRLHPGEAHLCATADQIESALGRLDAAVTTRLHGMVLSLKAGTPVVAVDPVAGGGKVRRQAEALGWPAVRGADDLDPEDLQDLLRWCLTEDARAVAVECVARARRSGGRLRSAVLDALDGAMHGP